MIHQIRVKAILVGMVAGFLAGAVWSIIVAMPLSPHQEKVDFAAFASASSPLYLLLSLVGALGSSLVAGCAYILVQACSIVPTRTYARLRCCRAFCLGASVV